MSCQPATGGTSVTSGLGAKPATYRNFSSACSKIMRRLLRDVAEGRELGDTSTLLDPNVFEAIRASK